jgi:hypothetical protein
MKALTLHRPWDQLILAGHKPVENRSWSTSHRGDLLIHGGAAYDPRAETLAAAHAPDFALPDFDTSPQGIVGVVNLTGVCSDSLHSDTLACDCGPWAFAGQRHWQLADPRPFDTSIPCRGFQQLWTPSLDVLGHVSDLMQPTGSA